MSKPLHDAETGENGVTLKTAILRAVLGKCPSCGEGKLFARYLKQVEACADCGARFGHLRADDAAPWATIIVVGHVFLPMAFWVDVSHLMPVWLSLSLWSVFFAAISMLLLPYAKGMMLAILWQTRATGEAEIIR